MRGQEHHSLHSVHSTKSQEI